MKRAGLYVHVPFCDKRCDYCDFVTFADRPNQVDPYLAALDHELSLFAPAQLETLFIGGGTPTALTVPQIDRLMASIRRHFELSALGEATVEANPESATEERLRAYRRGGINRLSIGLQSADDATLARLGRLHDYGKFLRAYETARRVGFDNVNIDLMFGLPGQTPAQWRETLDRVIALAPDHVSAYALKVENGTRFAKQGVDVDDDAEADMYLEASDALTAAGYEHYEISNFARPGRASRHNLRYWTNADTIGAGVSAAGFLDGVRWKNTTRFADYIQAGLEGRAPDREETALPKDELDRETMMLNLRLRDGVDATALRRLQVPVLDTFLSKGWATEAAGKVRLNPAGWLVSNQLFQHFVS
jgi:oxygen-independent coproporphyrinogen-3 oxidase